MDIDREVSEAIKIWLGFGGLLLLIFFRDLARKKALALLGLLTLVAGLNYAHFGFDRIFRKIDSYDVLHYYMGAKYFEELGYYDLYPALILADSEHPNGPYSSKLEHYRAQDPEKGYLGRRPISEAIERGKIVRSKFDQSRWKQFCDDFYVIQRGYNMSPKYFRNMLDDRGFNGTPVWVVLAKPLTSVLPARYAKLFCSLDILLLLFALGALYWAYADGAVVLFVAFFLFITYSLRWPVPGQAFLRYDWVSALVIAMCLLKKSKHAVAGIFVGLATMVRFFPAAWMFGLAAQGLGQLVRPKPAADGQGGEPRLNRSLLIVAASFVLTSAVLLGAAYVSLGGDSIVSHAENISEHTEAEELSSRRMGFAIGYSYDGALEPKFISDEQKRRVEATSTERLILSLLLLAGLGFGVRHLRQDEAFALGFVPFFLLATASYYYAVARITLVIFHAQDLKNPRNQLGLAALIGLEIFSNWAETSHAGHRAFLVGYLSWGLIAYSLGLIGWLVYESIQSERRPSPEPEPELS